MKKFINRPDTFLEESLRGFAATHADLVELDPGLGFLRRKVPSRDKVAIVSGGGAGHEPLHIGFVGQGMLDAACPGQVFTSPTPGQLASAIEAVDSGFGTLLVVKNYEGDVMNFDMAVEMSRSRIARVLVDDDVSIRPFSQSIGRRGSQVRSWSRRCSVPQRRAGGISLHWNGSALKSCRASVRWALRSVLAPCRPSDGQPSILASTKWKSALGFTARQVCAALL